VKIRFEPEVCTGHGRCYALAPEVFDADDLGHCVVKLEDVPEQLQADARTAVANCPEVALFIDD
jgi:ferredoxin